MNSTRGNGGKKKSSRKERLARMRKEQGARATEARKHANISQIEMGRMLAHEFKLKAPQMYFRQETGIRGLSADQLKFIARHCGVRLDWLTFGEGSMLADGLKPLARAGGVNDAHELEQPIMDLWNDGCCNPISPADVAWLRWELERGIGPDVESLELSLKGHRCADNPSEENLRVFNEACDRRRREQGMHNYHSSAPPPSSGFPDHEDEDLPILKAPPAPRLPAGMTERRKRD
jgi:hypothetical protein